MSNGARTRDNRDHNPVLYQLSYTHHAARNERTIGIILRPLLVASVSTADPHLAARAEVPDGAPLRSRRSAVAPSSLDKGRSISSASVALNPRSTPRFHSSPRCTPARRGALLASAVVLVGCAHARESSPLRDARAAALSEGLVELVPRADAASLRAWSALAVDASAQLGAEYRVTTGPWTHNGLFHLGLRDRGLCYHFADDLGAVLRRALPDGLIVTAISANARTLREHNAIAVHPRNAPWTTGIVLDPWRGGGVLHWDFVANDEYPWEPTRPAP